MILLANNFARPPTWDTGIMEWWKNGSLKSDHCLFAPLFQHSLKNVPFYADHNMMNTANTYYEALDCTIIFGLKRAWSFHGWGW